MIRPSLIPTLDLHGMDREISRILINEFVSDHITLRTEKVIIVHGKGSGILKMTTQEVLSKNRNIERYYIDFFNDGCTIVELKKKN